MTRTMLRVAVAIILALVANTAEATLLPPFMTESVVAIGIHTANGWQTLGTGFFYGYKIKTTLIRRSDSSQYFS